jgi:hypothetical protein
MMKLSSRWRRTPAGSEILSRQLIHPRFACAN